MVRKILEEKPIPLGQVYEYLQIREESGINYVQRVTAQHAEKLSQNAAYSEEVIEAIQEEFNLPRLLVVQLINVNPETELDVRSVIGDKLSKDQTTRLLDRYIEFVGKLYSSTDSDDAEIDSSEEEEEAEPIDEGFDDL